MENLISYWCGLLGGYYVPPLDTSSTKRLNAYAKEHNKSHGHALMQIADTFLLEGDDMIERVNK